MRAPAILLLLALSVRAGDAHAAAVREMDGLARWCAEQRLFGRLNDLYGRLLKLEPDHARARRRLGYRRQRGGPWVLARTPKQYTDRNLENIREYERRLRAIGAAYARAALDRVESGEVDPLPADRLCREILVLDPDHPRARALRGDVRGGHGWEMRETASARKRVPVLRAAAREARESAAHGRPDKLTAGEQALGVAFRGILRTKQFRVASPGSFAELPEMIVAAGSSRPFFGKVFAGIFDGDAPAAETLTLLVFADGRNYATALRKHPRVPDGLRRSGVAKAYVWVPSTETVLLRAALPAQRRELCARVALDRWIYGAFGLDERTGWAWDGMGLYLGYRLTGERSHATAPLLRGGGRRVLPPSESKLWSRMKRARSNWFRWARDEAQGGRAPELALLLHKDARTFRPRDLLYSYVLTAYLLETQIARAAPILRKIGGGSASAGVLEAELGMALPVLERRLADWVGQRLALGDGVDP